MENRKQKKVALRTTVFTTSTYWFCLSDILAKIFANLDNIFYDLLETEGKFKSNLQRKNCRALISIELKEGVGTSKSYDKTQGLLQTSHVRPAYSIPCYSF